MAITLEQLHETQGRLERELREIREALRHLSQMQGSNAEEWLAVRRKQVQAHNQRLLPFMKRGAEQLGATVQPMSAEQVQELMRAEGVQPQDNLGSAGIIQMREE